MAKKGATFTIMLAGESGVGKTTFINTLFSTTVKNYADNNARFKMPIQKTVEIGITKAELEEKGFSLRLNIIDTPGFGDNVNNKDAWQPLVDFVDDQHESYMRQEQQPNRRDRIDMRVHACLYFIRPSGHTLKPLDIEAIRQLSTRVNVIPVIAKADTLTAREVRMFKDKVREVLRAQNIRLYKPSDPEDSMLAEMANVMPFSVIGSEREVETADGKYVIGRQYLWGNVEVENEDHCDFSKLRVLLIRQGMVDLIQTTEQVHYENYRNVQMETRKFGEARQRKLDNPKFKEEEEQLRKKFTEQVKAEEQRFRQWESNLIAERDRLNKDLEDTHAEIKALEQEYEHALSLSRKR